MDLGVVNSRLDSLTSVPHHARKPEPRSLDKKIRTAAANNNIDTTLFKSPCTIQDLSRMRTLSSTVGGRNAATNAPVNKSTTINQSLMGVSSRF